MNGYEKLVKELLLKHGYKLVRTGKHVDCRGIIKLDGVFNPVTYVL
ncbi:MAG: hypothetical protein QX196_01215 [Methylococcaceae bacterium]